MDVPFHGEAEGTFFVVPLKVDAGVLISFPVRGNSAVLLESGEEVFDVAFLHILNA